MSERQYCYYYVPIPKLRHFQSAAVEAMKLEGVGRPIVLRISSLDTEISLAFVPASYDLGFTLLCLLERSWHENEAEHYRLVFACLFPGLESSCQLFVSLFGQRVIGTFTLIVDAREPHENDRVAWHELSPFVFTQRCFIHFGDDEQRQ